MVETETKVQINQ